MKRRELIIPRCKLDTKVDIPFPQAQVSIYQPSYEEISLIGESEFLVGVNALSKDYKSLQDNFDSSNLSNFDILMSIISEKNDSSKMIAEAILKVLFLLFPNYKVGFTPRAIILQSQDEEDKQPHMIDSNNFEIFQQIIYEMFCLSELSGGIDTEYNPAGDRARALVEQFKKKKELLAELRKERGEDSSKMSLYGRYMNILAVGERKDKNVLKKYSVYQLTEEFKRFQLKEGFDYTFQAKMAGATKIKDAKDWMDEIQFGESQQD